MFGSPRSLRPRCLDQVGNANESFLDLTPVSEAPAQATRNGWAAWKRGQAVPLIWEAVRPDGQSCDDQ